MSGRWEELRALMEERRVQRCDVPGCPKAGSYGFGVAWLATPPRRGRWYCLDHKHLGEAAAAPVTASPDAKEQGRLL